MKKLLNEHIPQKNFDAYLVDNSHILVILGCVKNVWKNQIRERIMVDKFKPYIDVERLDKEDCEGLLLGVCYIFPKIDGTNASIWLEDGQVHFGSRTRDLSIDEAKDNFDFRSRWGSQEATKLVGYFKCYPDYILYGEYLVPHSLKTYRASAWKRFYVFDVYNKVLNKFVKYDEYIDELSVHGIDFIPLLRIISNPSTKQLENLRDQNTYLIEDGKGLGEGIVIKQYNWENKFHRVVYGKLVRNEFKEDNMRAFGGNKVQEGGKLIEMDIVQRFVTDGRINKVLEKMKGEKPWESRRIPELLHKVYNDFITEEIWDILKKWKQPTINFRTLMNLTTRRVKEIKKELF